ncbi:uncharacterized protein LOC123501906 isoform X3 [Portunus trituberculatus]|uniref:uncharacterized protein LOC123501906 isoform X3 n=1 Tax=Portunus trituberculatus TaxID=210409 RepID=UPI001E1CB675|nr:uncharacterized protein LOC123501906 isoform X3 [Portunus trituberculatus]
MSVCLISEVEFILSPNARLSPVHVSQWESKVAFCLGGLIRLIYCKVTMNTNDLPPSYEDATNSVPPTQTDLAHHYTPPPPFASLPVTAPPVPGIPQPTQPYPTNGTPHTLPTYRRPTVVLQNVIWSIEYRRFDVASGTTSLLGELGGVGEDVVYFK